MMKKIIIFFRKFQTMILNAKSKYCSPMGPLSPLKVFTLKMATTRVFNFISCAKKNNMQKKPNISGKNLHLSIGCQV